MKQKIKIAVNTRFLIPNKLEGIGTYSHQVLQLLVKLMPEIEFHFLFDRDYTNKFIYNKNVVAHKLSPSARHPFLWYYWFEFSVTRWLKKNKVDLFISLDSFMSLKTETKTFLVVHDLAFEHYPKHIPFLVRKYYQYFFPKYAKKADKIFSVSEFTKQDLISKYNIDKDKIYIAYCGVADIYNPLKIDEQQSVRNSLTNDNPYFICIGSLNPRKNIKSVVQAFNLFKEEENNKKHKLVIVGAKGWKTNKLYKEISQSKYKKDIILLGHLAPKQLSKYLASSAALVFPSLFEGFGIPIVEAYKCQVPVITSNRSSTNEVGNGSSILINPNSVLEIKNALLKITENNFWTDKIKTDRIEKLSKFDWNKTAIIFKNEINKFLKNQQ